MPQTGARMTPRIDYEAIRRLLANAEQEGRHYLTEYEVYELIRNAGSESVPRYAVLSKTEPFDPVLLDALPGDRAVVKIVSPTIMHKSDVGGVRIVAKKPSEVLMTIRQMYAEVPSAYARRLEKRPKMSPKPYAGLSGDALITAVAADIQGVVLCQYIHPDSEQFGNELLLSLRRSREFGMILTAGLGGVDAELYAARFRKGQAIVAAATNMLTGEQFFQLFRKTISYKKLAGLTRGGRRIVSDAQLFECFSSFIEVGNAFSPMATDATFILDELEINPLAFSEHMMLPLDGLCRFSRPLPLTAPRPLGKIDRLLHPSSIGIAGISTKGINIGRIIFDNIVENGFDRSKLVLIHPEATIIDGIPTVADLRAISSRLDLLILAVHSALVPEMIDDIISLDLAASVILIPGGLGEKEGQEEILSVIRAQIAKSRTFVGQGPVFLGGNSLGVLSHPGRYDAMFIPDRKLPKDRSRHKRRSALVSQSGGYMIARMSKLTFLDPAYAVSIGNQIDLTVSDFMKFFNDIDDVKTIGFYVEGFRDLDGLELVQAIRKAAPAGKDGDVRAYRIHCGQLYGLRILPSPSRGHHCRNIYCIRRTPPTVLRAAR